MLSSVSFGGRPPVRPARRAAARPAWVCSRIRLRSNSASAPNTPAKAIEAGTGAERRARPTPACKNIDRKAQERTLTGEGATHGIATRQLILSCGREKRYWCGRRPEIGEIIMGFDRTRSRVIALRQPPRTKPRGRIFWARNRNLPLAWAAAVITRTGGGCNSSEPSSACARPDRPSRLLRCLKHVPSASRTLRKSAGKSHFSRSMADLSRTTPRVDLTSHALIS